MSQATALEWGASQRAALDHGKPMIYVCPPAGWATRALFERLGGAREPTDSTGLRTLCLVPDAADALDLAGALADARHHQPVHPCTGLTRTERLLRAGGLTTLLITPTDALDLTKRAALKTDSVEHVLIMWPERFDESERGTLDSLLSETRALQRIIVTADPSAIGDIIERQARRAPVAIFAAMPEERAGSVQFALVDPDGRPRALRAALDVSPAGRTLIWLPYAVADSAAFNTADVDLLIGSDVAPAEDAPRYGRVIAADLPTQAVLEALRTCAKECVVLLRPPQLPYLERMVAQTRPLRLPAAVDRARDRVLALRNRLRAQAESADLTGHLMAIEPLLEDFDPTVLAAAALAGWQVAPPTPATWTRVHMNLGRRDDVRPGDFVGLLLNVVGLRREDVGRIDLRDQFSLIEIRPEDADRVISGLAGQTIRGRRVVARLDRR